MVKFGDMVIGTDEACRKCRKTDGVIGVVILAEEDNDKYIIVFSDSPEPYFADRQDFRLIERPCDVIDCPLKNTLKHKEF